MYIQQIWKLLCLTKNYLKINYLKITFKKLLKNILKN